MKAPVAMLAPPPVLYLAEQQSRVAWRAMLYFSIYRLAIGLMLGLGYWRFNDLFTFGIAQPELAVPAMVALLVVAPIFIIGALIRYPTLPVQVALHVVADVLLIGAIAHASGGARSGLGLLLLITVAAAAMMSRGRMSLFYASFVAIAVLIEQTYRFLAREAPVTELLQGALLAIGYFVVALVTYNLARFATVSQRVAEEAGQDLANMAAINALVVRDMHDGFVLVDEQGVLRQANPAAQRLLGLGESGNLARLEDAAPALVDGLGDWRDNPVPERSRQRMKLAGQEVIARFVNIGGGRKPATVVFLENLERAKQEAQNIKLASLGRLSASIAHEIRNPLSSISHAAELMQEESRPPADARLVTIIRDNVFRLDRLVEEVLYLNRRDRAKPERVYLAEHLPAFIDNFCTIERLPRDICHVQCESDMPLLFDRGHLDQILWNLMRNAWRHSQKQPGSLSVHVAREPGGLLAIEIADDGPGVRVDVRPHLFEPFFTTEAKGTGLGLYIARELAHANGGELEYVAPTGGEGALFRLTGAIAQAS